MHLKKAERMFKLLFYCHKK